jgi:hypothetical protein
MEVPEKSEEVTEKSKEALEYSEEAGKTLGKWFGDS